jgi:hypothetical protein
VIAGAKVPPGTAMGLDGLVQSDINWAALAPVVLVVVGFVVFCLVDLSRHDVRYLPKWAWAVICIASVPLGGIVYLLVGREPGSSR